MGGGLPSLPRKPEIRRGPSNMSESESESGIKHLLEAMVSLGASDLHVTVGSPPMFRIDGDLRPVNSPAMSPKQTEDMMQALAPAAKRQLFDQQGTADFSYSISGVGRYRVNIYHQRGSTCLAIRRVNNRVLTIEELGLPAHINAIADHTHGLVLVTGVTGSGKSTTLASIIRHINDTRRAHIITLEDPIEFLHTHNKSLVNQIELGVDMHAPEQALKQVLRQDPDVILYGELRDRDAVRTALSATETGHLVLASLHTADAQRTFTRILNLFDKDEERLLLQELSMHLLAIISQRLVRPIDGKGRIVAYEIMLNTPPVALLIARGEIAEAYQAVRNGDEGMITFHNCLVEMVRANKVSLEEALRYVDDAPTFKRNVEGHYSGGDKAAISRP